MESMEPGNNRRAGRLKFIPLIAVALAGAYFLSVWADSGKTASRTLFALNTIIQIDIYGRDLSAKEKQQLLDGCNRLINEYEKKLSVKIPGTEADRINEAKGGEVIISEDTLELLQTAYKYSELTEGCFDITVKPLVDLWGIGTDNPQVPDDEAIKGALKAVGYKNIRFTDKGLRLLNGAQIDLGGIAKGHIADRTAEYLRQGGCRSGIVNMGGNVVTIGAKPKGEAWRIGVRKPFADTQTTLGVLEVRDMSVVTSGGYERFFERDGKLYHHIIDPETGRPAESDLDSATVISKESMDGDALSTACFVMGSERALALLESLPDMEGILIKKDGEILKTSGIGRHINFTVTE